jgi:hypothetical protein
VRMPVRIAVSPNWRTVTSFRLRCGTTSRLGCLAARRPDFFQTLPSGITITRLSTSTASIAAPSPVSNAWNHLPCSASSSFRSFALTSSRSKGSPSRTGCCARSVTHHKRVIAARANVRMLISLRGEDWVQDTAQSSRPSSPS